MSLLDCASSSNRFWHDRESPKYSSCCGIEVLFVCYRHSQPVWPLSILAHRLVPPCNLQSATKITAHST
jgi:hypothetical protein